MDFGGRGQGQWSAKRSSAVGASVQAAESKADVTGTWAFQVETGAGTGTPTMTFKQDGEKLSGHYSGQLGEAPLTGTIKGNAIEFTIDVDSPRHLRAHRLFRHSGEGLDEGDREARLILATGPLPRRRSPSGYRAL